MSHPEIISTLIEWIDEHIDQPLNIDVVAKKSGYSKWYLQRMFRTVMRFTADVFTRVPAGIRYHPHRLSPSDQSRRVSLAQQRFDLRLIQPAHQVVRRHRFSEVPPLTELHVAF